VSYPKKAGQPSRAGAAGRSQRKPARSNGSGGGTSGELKANLRAEEGEKQEAAIESIHTAGAMNGEGKKKRFSEEGELRDTKQVGNRGN